MLYPLLDDSVRCCQLHIVIWHSVNALVHWLQTVPLLEAKIEMLRGNLTTARQELDEAAGLKHELEQLRVQLNAAGIEPESADQSAAASQPADIPISTRGQQSASPGQVTPSQISPRQVSPSQISPFQSVAMQEPGQSWIQSPQQSAEGFNQSEGLQSGLQSAEPSALFSGAAVAQLQQQIAALKAELAQLSQREAAEEADVAGLQSQNRDLIAEVEKLRAQVGEVYSSFLAHDCSTLIHDYTGCCKL